MSPTITNCQSCFLQNSSVASVGLLIVVVTINFTCLSLLYTRNYSTFLNDLICLRYLYFYILDFCLFICSLNFVDQRNIFTFNFGFKQSLLLLCLPDQFPPLPFLGLREACRLSFPIGGE